MESYYAVVCKFGHVGKSKYVEKAIAIKAESGVEAAKKGRTTPRVKHDHKDAIIDVINITETEYYDLLEQNRTDTYFQAKSKQEQRLNCDLTDYIKEDHHNDKIVYHEGSKRANAQRKLKKYKEIELSYKYLD